MRTASTFERVMKDKKRKEKFDKKYNIFLLSEFLLEEMEKDKLSVRKLAKKSGISASIIQNIRSGKKRSLEVKTLADIAGSFGYDLVLKKGKKNSTYILVVTSNLSVASHGKTAVKISCIIPSIKM